MPPETDWKRIEHLKRSIGIHGSIVCASIVAIVFCWLVGSNYSAVSFALCVIIYTLNTLLSWMELRRRKELHHNKGEQKED